MQRILKKGELFLPKFNSVGGKKTKQNTTTSVKFSFCRCYMTTPLMCVGGVLNRLAHTSEVTVKDVIISADSRSAVINWISHKKNKKKEEEVKLKYLCPKTRATKRWPRKHWVSNLHPTDLTRVPGCAARMRPGEAHQSSDWSQQSRRTPLKTNRADNNYMNGRPAAAAARSLSVS